MIVNRKHGVYKIYELKGCRVYIYWLKTGQDDWLGSVDAIRNEINRREKQKKADWNRFEKQMDLLINRSR